MELSKRCAVSVPSVLIGAALIGLTSLPLPVSVYVLTIIGSLITTFVANAATAPVLLPIMFQVVAAFSLLARGGSSASKVVINTATNLSV